VLTFSGLNLSIPAGQTVTLTLAIDVSANLSAGNTTGFALTSASAVSAFDGNNAAVTPSGSFPLTGNTFTVTTVNNPSLASIVIGSSSIGTTVTAGTQGNIVGSWDFKVQNSPVYLQNLNFHVIGSAAMSSLQNVKLMVNGTQVGQTLSQVSANQMADFSATGSSIKLNTGDNNIQVIADVTGSPSDYFQFEVLNGYDVLGIDSQYNVPVSVTNNGGIGTQVKIQTGQITVNQDTNTPTGNIAKGQSGVVLAKYDVYAAGEPVKVKFLDFSIALGGQNPTLALSSQIQNVAITDDAGNQVGTSINQPPSLQACQAGTSAYNASTGAYTDCFGTPSSPINYIVPANTTRVLSLKADIQTTASINTITANKSGNTGNLQGMTSSQTANTAGATGVALTLVASSLNVTANNALGTQNVSAGVTNLKIGSYAFSASSAEGVNVNTVTVELTPNSTSTAFQNLKLFVNGTQFGTTSGVLSGETNYSFSGTAFNVPAGQTVNVDVFADTLSAATGTYTNATALVGYSGTGATSFTSVNSAGTVNGQSVSFNGQPALTIAVDATNPPASIIVQNLTGETLAVFRFTETSNVENVKVTQLNVLDKISTSTATVGGSCVPLTGVNCIKAAFSNVSLWNGSQNLGAAASPVWDSANGGWDYNFNSFTNALVIPQGNSASLTLKGDAGSYINGSMTDNTTSTFEVVSTGAGSNYVMATPASSVLSVNVSAMITPTSTTPAFTVTVNGATTPSGSATVTLSSTTSTSTQENAIATAIASELNAHNAYYSLPANSAASTNASGTTPAYVTINSNTVGSLGASASVSSYSAVISATNNAGTPSSGTSSTVNVIARGATSNKTATVTLSPSTGAVGSPMTLLQTTITPSLAVYGGNTQHNSRSTQDKVATLTLSVDAANSAALNTLKLTLSGNLVSSAATSTFLAGVDLLDQNGVSVTSDNTGQTTSLVTSSTAQNGDGSIYKLWTFATSSPALQFTKGTAPSFTLVVNDNSGTAAPTNGISYGLQVSLQGTTDLTFYDSLGTGGTLVQSIPASTQSYTLPLQTSISFVSGS
jgi:hypothetical protein